jgi:hypothetical protein
VIVESLHPYIHPPTRTPILGDELYGISDWNHKFIKKGVRRPLLHALSLSLPHPNGPGVITKSTFPPNDLISVCRRIMGKEEVSMQFLLSGVIGDNNATDSEPEELFSAPESWY